MRRVVDSVIRKSVNYVKTVDLKEVANRVAYVSLGAAMAIFVPGTIKDYFYPPVDWGLEAHKELKELEVLTEQKQQQDQRLIQENHWENQRLIQENHRENQQLIQKNHWKNQAQLKRITDLLGEKKNND